MPRTVGGTDSTFVVLLRGVNVDKAKRVPMADFTSLLADLGCKNVTTLLNSGNAVVEAAHASSQALAKKVALAIAARLGFEVPVVAKSSEELNLIVERNALAPSAEDHSRLLVAFGPDKTSIAQLGALTGLVAPSERFLLDDHAAYLHCAGGILNSRAATALVGKVGKAVTTRNWATVLKLHALAASRGAQPVAHLDDPGGQPR